MNVKLGKRRFDCSAEALRARWRDMSEECEEAVWAAEAALQDEDEDEEEEEGEEEE